MSWFKKKKKENPQEIPEKLPTLPELPKLPETNQSQNNLPPLPSNQQIGEEYLPPSEFNTSKNFHQEIPPIYSPRTKELSSGKGEVTESQPRTLEISETELLPTVPKPIPRKEKTTRKEPVFVRIDKYQAAVQAFNEINNELTEIESKLKEIKQLKIQEEQELAEWESQIETIKARLNNIDSGVFGKLS